jgi:hypothetical protein
MTLLFFACCDSCHYFDLTCWTGIVEAHMDEKPTLLPPNF